MSIFLGVNQNYVQLGNGTLTFTVPTTGQYNVQVQGTVAQALLTGAGAGSATSGHGAGAGGGGEGFTGGDLGVGHGGVGQGFGAGNGYQQPPADVHSSQTTGPAINSALTVLVKKNGSTIFTAPAIAAGQSAFEFKYSFQAAAADSITVVFGSDSSVKANVSIGQGL